MLSMIFSFLTSIKPAIIKAVKWCTNIISELVVSNLIGVQTPN